MKRVVLVLAMLLMLLFSSAVAQDNDEDHIDFETFVDKNGAPGFSWSQSTWNECSKLLRSIPMKEVDDDFCRYVAFHTYEEPGAIEGENYHVLTAQEAAEIAKKEYGRNGFDDELQSYAICLDSVIWPQKAWKVTLYNDRVRYTFCISIDGSVVIEPLEKQNANAPWYTSFIFCEILQYDSLATKMLDNGVCPHDIHTLMANDLKKASLTSIILEDIYEYGLPPITEPYVYADRLYIDNPNEWPMGALIHIDYLHRLGLYIRSDGSMFYDHSACYITDSNSDELSAINIRKCAEAYGTNNHLGKIERYNVVCFGNIFNAETLENYEHVWIVHVQYSNDTCEYTLNFDARTGEMISSVQGSWGGNVG